MTCLYLLNCTQDRKACEEVNMKSITIKAFAKVNLCLDVRGLMEDGYHEVAMILQQIDLHDKVRLDWTEAKVPAEDSEKEVPVKGLKIGLGSSRRDIPMDESNLAWRAAQEIEKVRGESPAGKLDIWIEKRIPMAAGLAGGSSDCAAVIHGLNILWEMGLSLDELCQVGARIGSDVPFCIMGQAVADPILQETFMGDEKATHCAIATGRGTDLEPISGLDRDLVLAKPDISVSTGEVYRGIDGMNIEERPDIDEMKRAIEQDNIETIEKNMINVLELFTLKRYPLVVYTKNKVQEKCKGPVLMSGSGPTIYCLCESEDAARELCEEMRATEIESYCTKTTF